MRIGENLTLRLIASLLNRAETEGPGDIFRSEEKETIP
jgi:hypothetical protein